MASSLEYSSGCAVNNIRHEFFSPRGHTTSETPPEQINTLWRIVLHYDRARLGTDDVDDMDTPEAKRRWHLLAPGRKVPTGYTAQTAVAFAEAIWLDTIWHSVSGHPRVVNTFFLDALEAGYDIKLDYNGRRLDWGLFREIGEEAGVDLRIDAWLDGVPLEYVLAE